MNVFRAFAASLHTDGVQTKGPLTLVRSVVRAGHESSVIERLPERPTSARPSTGWANSPPPAPNGDLS